MPVAVVVIAPGGVGLAHLHERVRDRVPTSIGMDDPLIMPYDVRALACRGVRVTRYFGAGHAYAHDPLKPTHRAEDAEDAWRRAREWLKV